jgi:hypothetical protein
VALVCKRTIPTERPPLVGEVNASLWLWRVWRGQRNGSPRPYSRISRQEREQLGPYKRGQQGHLAEGAPNIHSVPLQPFCWALVAFSRFHNHTQSVGLFRWGLAHRKEATYRHNGRNRVSVLRVGSWVIIQLLLLTNVVALEFQPNCNVRGKCKWSCHASYELWRRMNSWCSQLL